MSLPALAPVVHNAHTHTHTRTTRVPCICIYARASRLGALAASKPSSALHDARLQQTSALVRSRHIALLHRNTAALRETIWRRAVRRMENSYFRNNSAGDAPRGNFTKFKRDNLRFTLHDKYKRNSYSRTTPYFFYITLQSVLLALSTNVLMWMLNKWGIALCGEMKLIS